MKQSADSGFPVILQFNKFNKRQIFLNQENYLNKATPAEEFIVKSIKKFVIKINQQSLQWSALGLKTKVWIFLQSTA